MGCLCVKEGYQDDDYDKSTVMGRRVQLFALLRYLRQYFPPHHPIICSCANVINVYHDLIGEPSLYLEPRNKINYGSFDREAICYAAAMLSDIKKWINNYTETLGLAFIELLKAIYYKDWEYALVY